MDGCCHFADGIEDGVDDISAQGGDIANAKRFCAGGLDTPVVALPKDVPESVN